MCKPKFKSHNTRMAEAIAESVHSELHRRILHAVLIDGWTYERTAESVDRTPRQVAYVISQHLPRLQEWMSENCIKV